MSESDTWSISMPTISLFFVNRIPMPFALPIACCCLKTGITSSKVNNVFWVQPLETVGAFFIFPLESVS